jgi:hypothetical protein
MYTKIRMLGLALASTLAIGCSSSRDVEVSGQVSAPATAQGAILIEFFEQTDSELESVHSIQLAAPGAFAETIPLEGDRLLVRATLDADGNGACSTGELWDEIETAVTDDVAEEVTLALHDGACPSD